MYNPEPLGNDCGLLSIEIEGEEKLRNFLGIIIYIVVVGVLGFAAIVGGLWLMLMAKSVWLIPYFAALISVFIIFIQLYHRKSAQTIKRTLLIVVGVMVATCVYPLYMVYHDSIPTVSAEINTYEYMPFQENSKLKPLDEEPTITFASNLPKLDGATALYPLYAAAAEMLYPGKTYDPYASEVMVNTTPEAYRNLLNGNVDAIFAAGPSEGQLQTAEENGLELTLTPIGREAFVFFVHANNPVDNVTFEDIQSIYSGQTTNWSSLGGNNDDIRAFQRPVDSGSQTTLIKIMEDVPVMEAPIENIEEGMGGIIQEVATYKNHKNAIGYTFRYYSEEMVGNDEIKYLAIDGVEPTIETIRDDSYPLSSEFYIITTQNSSAETLKLVDWFTSEQGQKLVEHAGYVPIKNTK